MQPAEWTLIDGNGEAVGLTQSQLFWEQNDELRRLGADESYLIEAGRDGMKC